jgi:hypothetical protein
MCIVETKLRRSVYIVDFLRRHSYLLWSNRYATNKLENNQNLHNSLVHGIKVEIMKREQPRCGQ